MTHSIEGIPTTEDKLLRAIKTLATSAMGIEHSLKDIADRLDGIEDSFIGLSIHVHGLEEINCSIKDLKTKFDGINALDPKISSNAKNPKPVGIKPLTGEDLLNKVREIGDVSKSELVEACGYIIPAKGNNKQRLHYAAFYEALLTAKGVDIDQLEKEASK